MLEDSFVFRVRWLKQEFRTPVWLVDTKPLKKGVSWIDDLLDLCVLGWTDEFSEWLACFSSGENAMDFEMS